MIMILVLSACSAHTKSNTSETTSAESSSDQVDSLRLQIKDLQDKNHELQNQIDTLETDKLLLEEELAANQKENDEILTCLLHMYDSVPLPYTQRFIEQDKDLRILPDTRLNSIRTLNKDKLNGALPDIECSYWLGFYDGDYAQLSGGGGVTIMIPRDHIIYPEINTVK
jgi:predicted RNase H-like nuclease (RuvC/YqgF family)